MDIPYCGASCNVVALPLCEASVLLLPPQALVLIYVRILSVEVKMVVIRSEKGERIVAISHTL
jgi:hypothetical protein